MLRRETNTKEDSGEDAQEDAKEDANDEAKEDAGEDAKEDAKELNTTEISISLHPVKRNEIREKEI